MNEIFERITTRKNRAKNQRDAEKYDKAIATLHKLIEEANAEFEASEYPEKRSRLARELADCFGLIGGIERRWALSFGENESGRQSHLLSSIQAYDEGFGEYESRSEFEIVDSYNLVNRLVGRILYDPNSLSGAKTPRSSKVEGVDVKQALENARDIIKLQLSNQRRNNVWALADNGLINLLLAEADGLSAFLEFILCSPPDYAFDSLLSTLIPLSKLESPVSTALQEAVDHLTQVAHRMFGPNTAGSEV